MKNRFPILLTVLALSCSATLSGCVQKLANGTNEETQSNAAIEKYFFPEALDSNDDILPALSKDELGEAKENPFVEGTSAKSVPSPSTVPLDAVEEPPFPPDSADSSTAREIFDLNNLPNQSYGWGFKKNKSAPPDILQPTIDTLTSFNGYYLGKTTENEKTLYLTFDEGYENGYTSIILDILKEHQVPAAFFVTGSYMKNESELVKRMVDEGHTVGNHTINHPSMPTVLDDEVLQNEMLDLERQFNDLTGQNMYYMRPPRGEYSERTLAITSNLGYDTVLWSFAYRDWEVDKQEGVQHAYDSVIPYLHDGAILLLHAVSSDNAGALSKIVEEAKNQGYIFKSLDQMK